MFERLQSAPLTIRKDCSQTSSMTTLTRAGARGYHMPYGRSRLLLDIGRRMKPGYMRGDRVYLVRRRHELNLDL